MKGERRSSTVRPKPQTLVQPLRDRRELQLRFPRVAGYISDAKFRISAEVASMPRPEGSTTHHHVPDFLVELSDGSFLVVEVKGLEREQDRSKEAGARRWVDALNHWCKLGRWRYAKIHSPHQLESAFAMEVLG